VPTPKKGYWIDDTRVPSVTQVLSVASVMSTDALCGWAARLAKEGKDWREERNRAGYIGTLAHDAIESFPAEPALPPDLNEGEVARIRAAWEAHAAWVERHKPKVVLQEVQLVSRSLFVGGTPDLVVEVDGARVLLDHKTGKSVDGKVLMQLGAYAELLRECVGIEVEAALVMHHPAGRPFEAKPLTKSDLALGLDAFKKVRALYDLIPQLNKAFGPERI